MLKTEQPASRTTMPAKRAERIAWSIMLVSFGVFCGIAYLGGSYAYYWATRQPSGVMRAEVYQQAVTVQKNGLNTIEILQNDQINPGDVVRVSDEATPGPATTLRFGSVALALWAGTELRVGQFGPQWNDATAATARFSLARGQLLIDLTDNDQRIEITTESAPQPIVLQSPGRYRVRVLAATSPTTAIAERADAPGVEIATERGVASIGSREILPGQRVVQSAQGQANKPREWRLLRDGTFQELVNSFFDRTNVAQSPWSQQIEQTAKDAAKTGQVRPEQQCLNPIERLDCAAPYVRLVRMGGNDKGFSTAIAQNIEADVSAYQHVWLRAELMVVDQSLSRAGESGTECPLLMRIVYTSDTAQNLQRDYCYWAIQYDDRGAVSGQPHIVTKQLVPKQWFTEEIDLKQDIPNLLKIQNISFQANGHDYESQVKNAQLTAAGLTEVVAP